MLPNPPFPPLSKKALTPIIAGSVCGGVMLIAWIIGFTIYFRKRYNRKKRNRLIAKGKAMPRPKDLEEPKEKVVIPPDPAVLLGHRQPGEHLFPERSRSKSRESHGWLASRSSSFGEGLKGLRHGRSHSSSGGITDNSGVVDDRAPSPHPSVVEMVIPASELPKAGV